MGYEERVTEINIFDFGGLDTRTDELTIPDNSSPSMDNVDLYPIGAVRKRAGYVVLASPAGTGRIAGLMRLVRPDQDDGFVYCIQGTKVYRIADPGSWAAWDDISTPAGITVTADLHWRGEMARYLSESSPCLYVPRVDGAPLILKGDATLADDLVLMQAGVYGDPGVPTAGTLGYGTTWTTGHWPTGMRLVGQGRGERMYAWGFADDPNLIAYSEMRVPSNFLRSNVDEPEAVVQPEIDGGEFQCMNGDGDYVTSVVDMFNYVIVFKRHKTVIWFGDPGTSEFVIKHVFPVGCVSDRAWVKLGNDILFWAEDGPHMLSAVQEYGDLSQSNLAYRIIADVTDVTPGRYENIVAYHDHENLRVIWFVPSATSITNNQAFQYFYDKPRWAPYSGAMTEISSLLKIDSTNDESYKTIAGNYDGEVVKIQSGETDGEAAIEAQYTTKWFHLGQLADGVRLLWIDMMIGDDGGRGLEIYYQVDFNAEWTLVDRVIKSMGNQGARYGKAKYGQSKYGDTGRASLRYELEAHARLVRFKFVNNGLHGFEILACRFEARKKGARL